MPSLHQRLPYCGAPPVPAELAGRWNLDPVLAGVLIAMLAAYLAWSSFAQRPASPIRLTRWRRTSFVAGWLVAALALMSPLCALSVALFSARIAQHLILMFVAAPLVVAGLSPGSAFAPLRRDAKPSRSRDGWIGALLAAAVFAVAIWFWHAPGPYLATFQSSLVYWTMHVTLFASAAWLWWVLLADPDRTLGAAVGVVALTAAQMGLLSAVITFAAHPLYTPHLLTTAAWGMTPLDDQQLGGALMWAPAGAILAAALTAALVRVLQRPGPGLPSHPSA